MKNGIQWWKGHWDDFLKYLKEISCQIGYQLRARLRSSYFFLIRSIVRDYNRSLSRSGMLKITGLESIDTILLKRTSIFIFSLVSNLSPTNHNDRTPEKLFFSDTSLSKFGKICITNQAKSITEQWDFDWLTLSKDNFKAKLREQYSTKNV